MLIAIGEIYQSVEAVVPKRTKFAILYKNLSYYLINLFNFIYNIIGKSMQVTYHFINRNLLRFCRKY